MWTCTDCGAEIATAEIHEHVQHEHGLNYAAPHPSCPECASGQPCTRVAALMGRD